ncbi:MAG: MaoC/PaaZ C-terminal domain-containing protein [Hydrogenophaga sp.]|uniref:MaoC/PaaZ C-terminal domain-containing protein n=1 Tax=Hydrogenophaga sp. TaxID=1904254 RepID=UPI003D0B5B75
MLDYQKTRHLQFDDVRHSYTTRDTILYALGIGMGHDPLDRSELRFVYEKDLQVVPVMASVLASPGFWMRERKELGIDAVKLVHGEQSVTLHAALPAEGTVIGRTRVTRIVDKGEGKGAIIQTEKKLFDAATDRLLATVEQAVFCRGDGGFSKAGGGDEAGPALAATPETEPDHVVDMPTRADAALLYRLSGDLNPLHADPDVAARAGFPRPILHGLATYGVTCRALLAAFCGNDAARLKSMRARMSSPVFPGETIRVECWRRPEGVAFRARIPARDVTVLSHGHADLSFS